MAREAFPTARKQSVLKQPVLQLQLLLLMAIALGGGGVAYGVRNLAIQLLALAIIGLNRAQVLQFIKTGPRMLVALVIASMAIPLIQLIPLPPAIWQALPGREAVTDSLVVAGLGGDLWFTASLDRARTLVALCGTFAPAAIIAIGANMAREEKIRLAWTTLAAAFIALLLGAVQLSSANTSGLLYPVTADANVLYASFANRNSTGLFFVISALLAACLPLPPGKLGRVLVLSGGVMFAIGAVLTQSRSSMALLGLVVAFAILRLAIAAWQARSGGCDRLSPQLVIGAAIAAVLAIALAVSAGAGGRLADGLERLGNSQTDRPEMWEDSLYAAQQYWPVGSGTGTFDEVFQLHESLEYVSPRKAGRAHSDVLEVAMESGLAGLLVAAGWLAWCGIAALLPSASARSRWQTLGAGLGIGCIALQSLLDYPLRNQSLLCVAALLVILLAPRAERAG